MLLRILLAVRPGQTQHSLRHAFEKEGAIVTTARSASELWQRLTHDDQDMVVLGDTILTDPPEPLIESIRRLPDRPEIVVIRPDETRRDEAKLLAAGVLAILSEGLKDTALADAVRALVARRRGEAITRQRADRPQERYGLKDFRSASPAMQRFMTVVDRVASSDSTVLIQGETGVGKERLARALHNDGPRARGPFIAVNCGAFPESLLESELFGHEEGAFTGATRSRRGYFELAHRGTLFLDEVGDIPTHLQAKLLRLLEERTLRRLGGERETRIDVRMMAATNRDLEADTGTQRFRLDLYYRLAVVTLTIPPLRDRAEDIPMLVHSYVDHFRTALRVPVHGLTPAAMNALCAYSWPGNVRELINVIERSMLLCATHELDLADLPVAVGNLERRLAQVGVANGSLDQSLLERPLLEAKAIMTRGFEHEYLTALLRRTGGKVGAAASQAGVNVRSIHDMMKRLGLRKELFK